ncbi:hypothetical protein DSM3645_03443 [Blastopirellula marina DSM 3645]|uniref:Uncharacterized protein n=1 Tax=Blastopirellula marina DSM 3645 TaxID=314230 RepID=A3ZW02_9BACT|nr:hypothetical protein DSM3645_03443 [Blastopirellula marina DSM 3645]
MKRISLKSAQPVTCQQLPALFDY